MQNRQNNLTKKIILNHTFVDRAFKASAQKIQVTKKIQNNNIETINDCILILCFCFTLFGKKLTVIGIIENTWSKQGSKP
jgi:Ran GTPase-activating protein (RanGAP) involved in mRNA processing and transport